jgi:hypothetical protein
MEMMKSSWWRIKDPAYNADIYLVFTAAGGISGLRDGQEEPLGAAFGREQCHLNRVIIRISLEACSTGEV